MHGLSLYRAVQHRSADADQIVLMLHLRALSDLRSAQRARASEDPTSADADLDHARRIFILLRRVLDHESAPALAENLDRVYRWAEGAVGGGDPDELHSVIALTEKLVEAWRQVRLA